MTSSKGFGPTAPMAVEPAHAAPVVKHDDKPAPAAAVVSKPEPDAPIFAETKVAPPAPEPEAPASAKVKVTKGHKPKTTTEDAPPLPAAAPLPQEVTGTDLGRVPESVKVSIVPQIAPQPILTDKTRAEMEEGRKTIAQYAARK